MSDDNYKDRRYGKATQVGTQVGNTDARAGSAAQPRRGVEVRTVVGLPIVDPVAVRAGLAGQARPSEQEGQDRHAYERQAPAAPLTGELDESDTRYMEPPSETLGRAPTEDLGPAREEFGRARTDALGRAQTEQMPQSLMPRPSTAFGAHGAPDNAEQSSSGMFGASGRGDFGVDQRTARPGPQGALGMGNHDPSHVPQRYSSTHAPEAWRNDVRRVMQRAPSPGGALGLQAGPQAQPAQPTSAAPMTQAASRRPSAAAPAGGSASPGSLRLKLDMAQDDFHFKGVPKSAAPKVLLWLAILGGLGGGAAYYVDAHGGVDNVLQQLSNLRHGGAPAATPALTDPATVAPTGAQPTAATNPVQPPAAATTTTPPSAAADQAAPKADSAPVQQPATDQAAVNLADPDAPSEAADDTKDAAKPAAAEPSKPAAAPKQAAPAKPARTEKPKAVAHAKPKPTPVRTPSRSEPVIKVSPAGAADDHPLEVPDLPPSPSGGNDYLPADPPAP